MNEARLEKWIKRLYHNEERSILNELDEESVAESRSKALEEYRQSRTGKSGGIRRIVIPIMKWAAAIILLIGIPAAIYFVYQDEAPDYSSMVEELSEHQMDQETSLILSDGSSITIESDESVITYDKSGERVEINADQIIALDKKEEAEEKELQYNRLVVPYGRKSTITLSDGSVVWLNSGSYLIYPQEFSRKKREVYLAGEAYFEVTENTDKPFIVTTDDIEIEVLGTTFNVNSYPENKDVETVLVEGSVKVSRSDASQEKPGAEFRSTSKLFKGIGGDLHPGCEG